MMSEFRGGGGVQEIRTSVIRGSTQTSDMGGGGVQKHPKNSDIINGCPLCCPLYNCEHSIAVLETLHTVEYQFEIPLEEYVSGKNMFCSNNDVGESRGEFFWRSYIGLWSHQLTSPVD